MEPGGATETAMAAGLFLVEDGERFPQRGANLVFQTPEMKTEPLVT